MRHTRRITIRAVRSQTLVALAVALSACAEADSATEAVVVRDSAGIRIVETEATGRFDASWQVDDTPTWGVGEVEGDSGYLLSRVVGAMQRPDGSVLVANGGTNELRLYDASGTLARVIGREGEGPGEFQYLRGLGQCREEGFTAFDLNWQVNTFDADGSFVERTTLTLPDGITPYNLACDPDGRFLVLGWGQDAAAGPRPGFHALHGDLLLTRRDGTTETDFGPWLSSERIGSTTGSRPHPAGRATVFDLHDGRVFVGTGERFEVQVRTLDGTLERLLRGPRLALEVTDSVKALTLEVLLRNVDQARRPEVRSDVSAWEWPERLPAYTALRVDPEGIVWTRAFTVDPLEGETWTLLDPDEGYLGDLHLPPGQELLEIGHDHLLVLSRSELDVERVERYGLQR
ncbi:MAG: hypothetical protein U5R14_00095 [Gemmatimonadota bacterium]|nr:hypothetical protein [Gemmatimonadota bacterium]